MIKKHGFTLAEVMIVVVVIGVVAALTIPNIVTRYQKSAQVMQVRKIVVDLENAAENIATDTGKKSFYASPAFDSDAVNNGFDVLLSQFDTTSFDCGTNGNECFSSTYGSISGENKSFTCHGKVAQLKSSASICVNTRYGNNGLASLGAYALINSTKIAGGMSFPGGGFPIGGGGSVKDPIGGGFVKPTLEEITTPSFEIYVDTNGLSGPNVGGRDMYTLYLTSGGTIMGYKPVVSKTDPSSLTIDNKEKCISSALGERCFEALEDDNWTMKY